MRESSNLMLTNSMDVELSNVTVQSVFDIRRWHSMVLFKIICLKMIRLCRIGASKSVRNLISARRCSTLTNSYEEDEPG